MHRVRISLTTALACLFFAAVAQTQESVSTAASLATPRVVQFSGVVKDALGNPRTGVLGLTFALYEEQEGGAALWLETQNVIADEQGRYTVLLGSTQPEGLPLDLFQSGEARWLGVQASLPGEEEQPRVLLVSVPYALKAADAETLGGQPLSSFVLAADNPSRDRKGAVSSSSGGSDKAGLPVAKASDGMTTAAVSGTGTTNNLVKWTDGPSGALGDATNVVEVGGNVGIGTTSPEAKLAVSGGNIRVTNGSSARIGVSDSMSSDRGYMQWTGAGVRVFNSDNSPLMLGTTDTERMRIDASGNVGIGTTNPTQRLDVNGTVKASSIIFPDSTTQTTAMPTAALTRGITYIAGCDWCGLLDDNSDEKTVYYNVVGTMTINSVTCFSDAGTPSINIGKNGGSGILTSNLVCSTSGSSTTSFLNNALSLGETLDLIMVTAGYSTHRVTVTIKTTLNQ
ncbi:MAG: hypothetical protein HYS38_07490 [Acidobacteria bacterium]|nr:hypothetical protein [Acidobacteriota bacterium]